MAQDNSEDDLEWHEFPEGEEPRVLTGFSTVCGCGKHDEYPGHGEYDSQQIFCLCPCHQVPKTESFPKPICGLEASPLGRCTSVELIFKKSSEYWCVMVRVDMAMRVLKAKGV
jgi:hypothetical protein